MLGQPHKGPGQGHCRVTLLHMIWRSRLPQDTHPRIMLNIPSETSHPQAGPQAAEPLGAGVDNRRV